MIPRPEQRLTPGQRVRELEEAIDEFMAIPHDGHSAVQHDPECERCQAFERLWFVRHAGRPPVLAGDST